MISKHTVIGFLVFSAVVLSCVLVLQVATGPRMAHAAVMTQSGNHAMTTALVDDNEDLLWMLDTRKQLLMVYGFNRKIEVELLAQVKIAEAFDRKEKQNTNQSLPLQRF